MPTAVPNDRKGVAGGGFTTGSGAAEHYDGEHLARQGVVVVSRLRKDAKLWDLPPAREAGHHQA